MGTTVVGGMLEITILGVLLVPAFYVAVERLAARRPRARRRLELAAGVEDGRG
jgi:hypothetical protein